MKRIKKILSFILVIVMLLSALPTFAFNITASAETEYYTAGYYTYTVLYGVATITDCNTSISGNVTIPSTLGGYPVTSIGNYAFNSCTSLTSIKIGNSVTSIGYNAFQFCESLESITIGNSVSIIDDYKYIFFYCTSLKSINVDSNNNWYSSQNGVLFNKEKSQLLCYPEGKTATSYTIPNSVTSIGKSAFYSCTSLKSIEIPNSVTIIGDSAFRYCRSLESITIPQSVISIGNYAFNSCTSLKSIEIPNSVTSIGNSAFLSCESLESITIPQSVTSIGNYAFNSCTSLTRINVDSKNSYYSSQNSVLFNKIKTQLLCYPEGKTTTSYTIPNSVTSIGNYAFNSCTSLKSIVIPKGVKSIGANAFNSCTSLKSIEIPNSIRSIGANAFNSCESLKGIDVDSDNSYYSSQNGVFFNKTKTQLLCYPEGKTATSYTIPNSVTSIGNYAFDSCSSLKSIVIPKGVRSISNYAFYSCTSLESIVIPNSVTSIGKYAFYSCTSLKSITIGNSVTSIVNSAFSSCTSLKDVYYDGTEKQWNNISIYEFNESLTSANIHFNSTECDIKGHIGGKATCKSKAKCCRCGEEYGELKSHSYNSATCTKAKTCTVCGITSGKALGHKYDSGKVTKKATCKETGLRVYTCTVCKATKTSAIAKTTSHIYKTTTTKAKISSDGKIVKKCSICKDTKITAIKSIKTIKLTTTEYTYNGKNKTPNVVVKDSAGKTLKKNTDYTVSYTKNNKNVGIYNVKVTFKGNYTGSKTLKITVFPAKSSVSKVTAGKKSLTVSVKKKSTQVTGYQIQYSTSKKFASAKTKTITSYKTTKATIKGLKAKKTYYVRVRTYKTVSGKKYYSAWSTYKYKKTK